MNTDSNVATNIEQFLHQPIGSKWSLVIDTSSNATWIPIQIEVGTFTHLNYTKCDYINDLNDDKYIVGKEISVIVEKDENNEIICDIPELELYSFGATKEESIKQLKIDIIELFDDLVKIPDSKLGIAPIKWKKFLKEHIVKKK